mgnify:CR=1 FL=1
MSSLESTIEEVMTEAADIQHKVPGKGGAAPAAKASPDENEPKKDSEAVKKAGTADVDEVKDAIIGVSVPNLTGGYATMMPNHHITKPVLIGEIQDNGQFSVVWETPSTVVGDAWSDYLPDSKNLISDWRAPLRCGKLDVESMTCEDGPGAE